jgi:hypothetical protein
MIYKIASKKITEQDKIIEDETNLIPIEKEGLSLSQKRSVSGKSRMRMGMGNRGRAGVRLGAKTRRIG